MRKSAPWSNLSLLAALSVVATPLSFTQGMTAGTDGQVVPFVGCKSDGQAGPLDAPTGNGVRVPLSSELANQLAYYKAEYGAGVLAPRGWHCFSTYGSSGNSLFVTPTLIDSSTVLSTKWKGFAGDAIQISVEDGGTSGRFGVASTISRLFPAHMVFVKKVISEGIEPASNFPRGPYPQDKVTYKSKEVAEYITPANTAGMGTESSLQKNGEPIFGAAILIGETPDLVSANVRLSEKSSQLTQVIIAQAEKDATHLTQ